MPARIPTQADFNPILSVLPHTLHFPSPPESTTAILLLFHGLGDSDANFSSFAQNVDLPGVLAITVRGVTPLPPSLLGDEPPPEGAPGHFHWGDDLRMDERTGELDEDPGFEKAERLVMDKLVGDVLLDKCGWELSDLLLFGFGNGGSLALGLASSLRRAPSVEDVSESRDGGEGDAKPSRKSFKGAVSLGGPLPASMVPSVSSRSEAQTPVLVVQMDDEQVDRVKSEFSQVGVVNWNRRGVDTPRDREEMLPIMKFFADRLKIEL